DRSRLAQVAHHRPLVGARLDAAVELREREHRALELLGERLQRARDLAEHGRAVLVARLLAARHQLQVVDDDEAELAVLARLPARAGAQLGGAERTALVDEDADLAELLHRPREAPPPVA